MVSYRVCAFFYSRKRAALDEQAVFCSNICSDLLHCTASRHGTSCIAYSIARAQRGASTWTSMVWVSMKAGQGGEPVVGKRELWTAQWRGG